MCELTLLSSTPKPWRMLSDAERERALSPSSCIGGHYQPFIEAYRTQSQAAQARTARAGAVWQTLHYGDAPTQTLELCTPAVQTCRGALVFFHGGYWQELSARDSLFPSLGCCDHNLAFVAVNYTLAPHATLTEIVAECAGALAYLQRHAPSFGFEPERIVVSGSSAGAHLAAMVCALSQLPLRGAILVSGIYELEPLLATTINAALNLSPLEAQRNSPLLMARKRFPPTLIAWGEVETDEFKRQSADFAYALAQDGAAVTSLQVPARNHFDVIMDLVNSATPLGEKALSLFNDRP